MYISTVPPNMNEVASAAIVWLNRLLDDPRLCGPNLPDYIRMHMYVNSTPRPVRFGTWQITDDTIYLPRAGSDSVVHPLTKLAILSAIASHTGAIRDAGLVTKITTKLGLLLKEEALGTYSNVVRSHHKPSRLAIDQDNFQIAAEMDGRWLLPSGAPVEVGDKWITMDF